MESTVIGAQVGVLTSLLVSTGILVALFKSDRRHQFPEVAFGHSPAANTNKSQTEHSHTLLIREYLQQQRRAFALLWVTTALGVVLLGILIGRLIVMPKIDVGIISTAIGFAGDLGLARGSFTLYRSSSDRLERALFRKA